ncbi:MAG: hypothetical protein Kow0049_32490 [Stanieria sp.]
MFYVGRKNYLKLKTIKNVINWAFNDHKILSFIFNYFHQNNINISDRNLFINGVSCSILQAGSKGWQQKKIKIKVVLEFEPDEPEKPESPLDEVRQEIINS